MSFLRKCPECGGDNHLKTKRCKHCDHVLIAGPAGADDALSPGGAILTAFDTGLPYDQPAVPSELTIAERDVVGRGYVATRPFKTTIGSTLVTIDTTRVLMNERVISALLEAGAPIVRIEEDTEVVRCPHCANLFPHAMAPAAKRVA